jgi:hypothetical protein
MSDTTLFMVGTLVFFMFAAGGIVSGAWFFIKLGSVPVVVEAETAKAKLQEKGIQPQY